MKEREVEKEMEREIGSISLFPQQFSLHFCYVYIVHSITQGLLLGTIQVSHDFSCVSPLPMSSFPWAPRLFPTLVPFQSLGWPSCSSAFSKTCRCPSLIHCVQAHSFTEPPEPESFFSLTPAQAGRFSLGLVSVTASQAPWLAHAESGHRGGTQLGTEADAHRQPCHSGGAA